MRRVTCVVEHSHDLAAVADPAGLCVQSPGHIEGGEAAARIHEAVSPWESAKELSHDLAAVVDPVGKRAKGASPGDIDGGEAAARIEEAMRIPERIPEHSRDLAAVVDPEGLGGGGI